MLDKKSKQYPVPQNAREMNAKYGDGYLDGFRCKLVMKLIELEVLPYNVLNFTIECPLEGPVMITATFQADERLDQAIADMEEQKTDAGN